MNGPMTPSELRQQAASLQQLAWRSIGPRKWLVGRAGVCKITMLAIQRWPPAMFVDSADTHKELIDYIATEMRGYKGYDRRYGSIWIILLSAVIGELVRWLMEWWKANRENQQLMESMKVFRGRDGQECL